MKKTTLVSFCLVAALALAQSADSILVSSVEKTVTETVSKEWRMIRFDASRSTGEIAVTAVYEKVLRVDGEAKSYEVIREVTIPWSQATNISSALVLVRDQFGAAMSTILTNTP